MTDKKAPAKWVPALFALAAVLSGANLIIDAVRGRDFDILKAVLAVMMAVVAVGIWRKIHEGGKAE
jgi:hypothetical protein